MKTLLIAGLTSLVLASTAVAGNSSQKSTYTQMTGQEIKSALVGNSLRGVDRSGKYVIHYSSDRKMKIVYNKKRIESGVWRIKGNKYCRRWAKLGGGKERCVTFHRNGNKIVWVQTGKITDHSVLLRGNPARL